MRKLTSYHVQALRQIKQMGYAVVIHECKPKLQSRVERAMMDAAKETNKEDRICLQK